MKEIGHCPRCSGMDIIVMKTIGARLHDWWNIQAGKGDRMWGLRTHGD